MTIDRKSQKARNHALSAKRASRLGVIDLLRPPSYEAEAARHDRAMAAASTASAIPLESLPWPDLPAVARFRLRKQASGRGSLKRHVLKMPLKSLRVPKPIKTSAFHEIRARRCSLRLSPDVRHNRRALLH